MRYLLNISDEIKNDRFQMLFDCECPHEVQKVEELYPLLGNAIDVFMLINDLGKQTMKENEVLEYL